MASIRVLVTDDRQAPVAGARVAIVPPRGAALSALTEADGVAVVKRLASRLSYVWSVNAAGHEPAQGDLAVDAEGRVTGMPRVVVVRRLGTMSGEVRGDGAGIAAVPVVASDA